MSTLHCRYIDLPKITDPRGDLVLMEGELHVPFAIARSFVVSNVPEGATRGEHAHKECHQLLVCLNGELTVITDSGSERREWLLNRRDRAVYLPPMIWGIQKAFSPETVMLVLASHPYEEADYIRNYEQFLLRSNHLHNL